MDLSFELIIVGKLFFALLLGGLIGLDRERHGKDAGIRTYAAVCIGATIFTSIAGHMDQNLSAVSRIIANIITGVGFLCAGIIYRNANTDTSQGLTTAATVWCTAGVGVAVGLNMFVIAIASALAVYFLLSLQNHKWYLRWKEKIANKLLNKPKST